MKITKSIVTNYSLYPSNLETYFNVPESLSEVSLQSSFTDHAELDM